MSDMPLLLFRYPNIPDFPFELFRIEDNPFLIQDRQRTRRDPFYIIFWITAGSGFYTIDFERYDIRPSTLYFIAPGQVHFWTGGNQEPITGYAMAFDDQLFQVYGLENIIYELDLFDMVGGSPVLYLAGQDAQHVQQIVRLLCKEFDGDRYGRSKFILSLLQILLILSQRRLKRRQATSQEKLTRAYLHLLKGNVTVDHHLTTYAQSLGVTVGYLIETVKDVTGQPAGVILRKRLALEAKRWLAHSDLTVSQIAEKLLFSDPSYLSYFFKREAGQTPLNFRHGFR